MTITIYLDNDTQTDLDAFCKDQGIGRGKGIKKLLEIAGVKCSAIQEDQKLRADLLWNLLMPGIEYGRDDIAFKAFQFGLDDGYATVRKFVQTGRLRKVNAKVLIRPEHLGFDKGLQLVAGAYWRRVIGQPHPGDEALIPPKLLVASELDNPSQ